MSWAPTHQDLFRFGLPAAACVPDARALDSVQVAANLFECRGHGFGAGDSVRIVGRAGGTPPAAIAGPTTWYQVATTTDNDFFALAGITLADAGTGALVVIEDFAPKIDDIMARRASWLVTWYKAGRGPWTTPPLWGPMIVAHLAAPDVATALRIPSARYDTAGVEKRYDDAKAFLAELNKGEPFSDGIGPVDATPLVPEMGPVALRLKGRGFLHGEREDIV
jgi:hypothetical protein